jgi:hypothetical protein
MVKACRSGAIQFADPELMRVWRVASFPFLPYLLNINGSPNVARMNIKSSLIGFHLLSGSFYKVTGIQITASVGNRTYDLVSYGQACYYWTIAELA